MTEPSRFERVWLDRSDTPMAAPGGVSVLDVVNLVLRHHRLLLAFAVLGILIGGLMALAPAPRYTAVATFIPEGSRWSAQGPGAATQSALAAQLGLGVQSVDAQSPQFYLSLVRSRVILVPTLAATYTLPTGSTGDLQQYYRVIGSRAARTRETALERLNATLDAGLDSKTGVVRLAVRERDPQVAAEITGFLLTGLHRFNIERRQSRAGAERRFAEDRLAQASLDLRRAEQALESFLQENRDFRGSWRLNFLHDRLARDVAMRQQVYATLTQSYEQSKIDEVRDTPVITVIDEPEIPARPDSRGVVRHLLLGGVVGVTLALLIALFRERTRSLSPGRPSSQQEYEQLKAEFLSTLRRPWKSRRPLL